MNATSCVLVVAFVAVCWGNEDSFRNTRTVQVSAHSEVRVRPDEILLELVVHTENVELLEAKKKNDQVAKAVLALAPAYKISADNMLITGMNVAPRYRSQRLGNREPGDFLGYDVTRTIEVHIVDLADVDRFLSDAFQAGVSNLQRFEYRLLSQRPHQIEARRLAVEYAKEKAGHLASLNGLKLGKALHIGEDVEWNGQAGAAGGSGGFFRVSDDASAPGKQLNPSDGGLVTPNCIVIGATVTIIFELTD